MGATLLQITRAGKRALHSTHLGEQRLSGTGSAKPRAGLEAARFVRASHDLTRSRIGHPPFDGLKKQCWLECDSARRYRWKAMRVLQYAVRGWPVTQDSIEVDEQRSEST